jgi:Collagen triple helix repeat (20 copies)
MWQSHQSASKPSSVTQETSRLFSRVFSQCMGAFNPGMQLAAALSLSTLLGLGASLGLVQDAIAQTSPQANTARVNLLLTRQPNESYDTLVRRAEAAAQEAARGSFNQNRAVGAVTVTVSGQNEGSIAPLLSLSVNRQDWSRNPNPQRWGTYFKSARSLLRLDGVNTAAQPANATPVGVSGQVPSNGTGVAPGIVGQQGAPAGAPAPTVIQVPPGSTIIQTPSGTTGVAGTTGTTGTGTPGGTVGTTGTTGNTGFQGTTGTTGNTGFQGTTGTTGNTGFQGTTGTTGNTGFQGTTGTTGNTGFQGTTGTTGTTGNTGFQGTTGTTGTTGNTGFQGTTGTTGTTGNTGFQGTTGTTGNTGFQGTTGTTGNTGFQGTTGTTGTNGFQGTTGTTGTNGFQGTTGTTGNTGFQGTTGTTGTNGFQGTTGFPANTGGTTGTTGTQIR